MVVTAQMEAVVQRRLPSALARPQMDVPVARDTPVLDRAAADLAKLIRKASGHREAPIMDLLGLAMRVVAVAPAITAAAAVHQTHRLALTHQTEAAVVGHRLLWGPLRQRRIATRLTATMQTLPRLQRRGVAKHQGKRILVAAIGERLGLLW